MKYLNNNLLTKKINNDIPLLFLSFFVIYFLTYQNSHSQLANDEDVDTLLEKANQFLHENNYTKAIEYFDKILAIDPNNINILLNKGFVLMNLKKYTEAIEYFDKVYAIEPRTPDVLLNKAFVLMELGEYKEALLYFDKVLAMEPNNDVAMQYKNRVLDMLRRY